MSNVNDLIQLLEAMPYPDEKPHSETQKRGKIKYISDLANDYDNVDDVIKFIKSSTSTTVMDIFEKILDSDLFKGD
jgi:hypothetical protein